MNWHTRRTIAGTWEVVAPDGRVAAVHDDQALARADLLIHARRVLVAAVAAPEAPADTSTTRPFETLMVVEGRWTGDDRLIMVDGLSWDGLLPMPLTLDHGAGCTSVVGRIDEMERRPGGASEERFIVGRGVLDLGGSAPAGELTPGQEAERQIADGFLRGVSVDIDSIEQGGVDPSTVDESDDAMWMFVVETARVRALALCPIPAFAEAYITLGTIDSATSVPSIDGPTPIPADEVPIVEDDEPGVIVIASGHTITVPSCPPAEWFAEPTDVAMAGALTVTDEGRVYGLLAPRDVRHIGRADGLTVPLGNVDYSRFVRGETIVEGGSRLATGNLTMGCGHGAPTLSAQPTIEHYDNSCSVTATVAVGECAAGVWVAGALLPDVSGDAVRRMMSLQLSGHWVPTEQGGYDLVAALLVPVPGFPYARRRPSVTLRDGHITASAIPVRLEAPSRPDLVAAVRRLTTSGSDCGCGDENGSADRLTALEARMADLEGSPELAAARAQRLASRIRRSA